MRNMKLAVQMILVFQMIFGSLPAFSEPEQSASGDQYKQKTQSVRSNGNLIQSYDVTSALELKETKAAYDEFSQLSKEEQFAEYHRLMKQMEDEQKQKVKEYTKLKNVIKRQVGQATIKFPKEMMVFAVSMGAIVAFKLFTNYAQNPVGMLQHLEHQLSGIGALSFWLFMASQGITAEYLSFMLKRPGAAVYINYLAMTVGFLVQSFSAELMADQNVKTCVASILTPWNFKQDEISACQQVYATYGTIEKLNQYGPSLASMLISTGMIGVGQNLLSKGLTAVAFEVAIRGKVQAGEKILTSALFFIPGKLQFTGFKALLVHGFNITLFVGVDQLIHNTVADIYDNLVQGSWIMSNRQEDITKFIWENDQNRWQKEFKAEDLELIEKTNRHFSNWKMANLRLVMEANANWKMMLENLQSMYFATHEFYSTIINSAATYKYDFFERQSLNKSYPLWGVSIDEVNLEKKTEKSKYDGLPEAQSALVDAAKGVKNDENSKNPYLKTFDIQIMQAPQTENTQSIVLQSYAQHLIHKYSFNTEVNKKWQFNKPKNEWSAYRPYNININLKDYNDLRKIALLLNSDDYALQGQGLSQINAAIELYFVTNGQFKVNSYIGSDSLNERFKLLLSHIEKNRIDIEKEYGMYIAELIRLKKRFGYFRPYYNPGEGYVRSLEKSETFKSALEKVKHPSTSGNIVTPTIGDYLISQMLCGPSIFEGVISTTRGFPAIFNPPRITNIKSDQVCDKFLAAQNTNIYSNTVGGYNDNQGRNYPTIWKMIIENIDPNIMGRSLKEGSQFTNYWDRYVTSQMKESYRFFQEKYKEIIFDLVEKLRPTQGSALNQGPVANGLLLANYQQLQLNLLLLGKIVAHTYVNKFNKNLPKEFLASDSADFKVNKNTATFEALKKRQRYIFKFQEDILNSYGHLINHVNEIKIKKDPATNRFFAFQLPDVVKVKKTTTEYEASINKIGEVLQKLNLISQKEGSAFNQSQMAMLELIKNQLTGFGQELNLYIGLATEVDWYTQSNNPKSDEEKEKMQRLIDEKKKQIQAVGPMRY